MRTTRTKRLSMKPITIVFLILIFTAVNASARELPAKPRGSDRPLVQLAILLDTSGSMEGLIEQAKGQLWDIVNELSTYRKNGRLPVLEVALYEYGNSSISKWSGYVRQLSPFTRDLDSLSSRLFSLRTNGGEEYCGAVIETAAEGLDWSSAKGVMKLMYIAGNEPFTQGPVPFSTAIRSAQEKGVVVNTIYCGDSGHSEAQSWVRGAQLASGSFMSIDHNHHMVDRVTPYDDQIRELGAALNKTYLPFGADGGRRASKRQKDADAGSIKMGMKSAMARTKAKASGLYKNESWDLVDAMEIEPEKTASALEQMPASMLPPGLGKLSTAQKKALIADKAKERKILNSKITSMSAKRDKFLAQESSRQGARPKVLSDSVSKSLQKLSQKYGFTAP